MGVCARGRRPGAAVVMLLLLLLLLPPLSWAVEVKRPRGVSLTNHPFYDENKPFTCLDGSATIPFDQVNDDYCDCKDGSDEPGTAACPNGSFHCSNTGYKPLYIPSNRVNDGVCDCCDGTDEYNSGIVCENTCKEKGRKERESLQELAEVTREGFRLKKILIEDWKKAREEKQKKLLELQSGKKSLEDQVELLRTAKEEAEKPEKEAKEQHQRLWEEQQAASKAQREQELAAEAFQELDDDLDGRVSLGELQTHPELDTDGDGTLSEGEAQSLLGGDAHTDAASFYDLVWAAIRDKYRSEALPAEPPAPPAPDVTAPKEEQPPVPPPPTEEDEEEEEEEAEAAGGYRLGARERALSPGLEESGLGLLARFAASALPSPTVGPSLSVVQLEAKQKARKKEERQSLMGTEFEYTDSESEVKVRKQSPAGLLRPKKGLGEPGPALAVPTPSARGPGPASPDKAKLVAEKSRKARKLRGPKEHGFEAGPEASDDDLWARRRSERIFLHDASAATPVPASATPAAKPSRCGKSGPLSPRKDTGRAKDRKDPRKKKKGKEAGSGATVQPPRTPALPPEARAPHTSSLATAKRSKAKAKGKEVKKENRGKGGAVSKLMESMAAEEDFEPNQDSSFSEDEHLPRAGAVERPLTPAPRSCVIDKDELRDGLRVLIPMDDKLLYAGHVQTLHSPDIYRVVVEGERGNRPHIYCLEQLLQEAINDVRPASTRFLPQGTRIAAYWSQQYRCLYPGTVVRGLLDLEDDGDLITVEFDDGDTGRIPLSHIRLLPPDYKIQCAEPSPALLVPSAKRRSRKTSKDTGGGKEGGPAGAEESGSRARGRGRKPSAKAKGDRAAILEEGGSTDEVPSAPLSLEPISTPSSKKSPPEPVDKRAKAPKSRPAPPQPSPAPPAFASCPAPEPFGELPAPATGLAAAPLPSVPITMPATRPKPKKARAAEEPGTKGPRRPGEEAELLVKLDHEGVTSPKSKKAKEALLLREDPGAGGWQEPKGLLGLGSYAPAAGSSEPKTAWPQALDGDLAQEPASGLALEDSGDPKSPDKAQAEQDGAEESESSGGGSSSSRASATFSHHEHGNGAAPGPAPVRDIALSREASLSRAHSPESLERP